MSSITRPLANRAVHLRITPRPSNLGESREIMRLLSGFGEIEYFKNLRYDKLTHPNVVLVIYKDADAVKECLRRSPIRFRMGRAIAPPRREVEEAGEADGGEDAVEEEENVLPKGPIGAFGMPVVPKGRRDMSTSAVEASPGTGSSAPESCSTQHTSRPGLGQRSEPPDETNPASNKATQSQSPPPKKEPLFSANPSQPDPSARIHQIIVNPSYRHFRDHVNVNAYHGKFGLDTKMFGQVEMARKVPLVGLSCMDWRADERPWDVVKMERERERSGLMKRESLGEMWRKGKGEARVQSGG